MATPLYQPPGLQGRPASTGSLLWKLFKLLLLLSLGSCCLCGIGLTALGSLLAPLPEESEQRAQGAEGESAEDADAPEAPVSPPPLRRGKGASSAVTLLVAEVPEEGGEGFGAQEAFSFRAKHALPSAHTYRARFTGDEVSRLRALHEELGEEMSYQNLEDTMRFVAPEECFTDYKCIYTSVWEHNEDAVRALSLPFKRRIEEEKLTSLEAADLVLSFVQSLPYLESNEYAFDVTPAALVVNDRGGDCDSKTVLGVMLLREVGVDAVLLMSKDKSHAALGLGLPVTGESLKHRGRKYVFVEMTEVAPFGFMPSRTGRVSQYLPVELP